jgi:hypothetical protein
MQQTPGPLHVLLLYGLYSILTAFLLPASGDIPETSFDPLSTTVPGCGAIYGTPEADLDTVFLRNPDVRTMQANPAVVQSLVAGCFGALAAVSSKLAGECSRLPGLWAYVARVGMYGLLFMVNGQKVNCTVQHCQIQQELSLFPAVQRHHARVLCQKPAALTFTSGHRTQQRFQYTANGTEAINNE